MLKPRNVIPANRFYVTSKLDRSAEDEPLFSDEAFERALQQAGAPLPYHLATRCRRWGSLLLVALSGAFAAGPIASWPTLQPLLIEEHVFAGPNQHADLTAVFSIAVGLSMISVLFGGIIYDAMGPKVAAVGGAVGAAVSLVVISIAIKVQSLNYLLWYAYPAATCFGYVNCLGCYAWLWLLPDEQNSVNAWIGAIQALSDSFVLVAVFLHNTLGLRLPAYFMMAAVLSLLAGIIAWIVVPSRKENNAISKCVVAQRGSGSSSNDSYGAMESATSSGNDDDADMCDSVSTVLSNSAVKIKRALTCWAMYPIPTLLFMSFMMFHYMLYMTYVLDMYILYFELLGKTFAVNLVNIWGGLFGIMGGVTLLAFGQFADRYGFIVTMASLNIPIVIVAVLIPVPELNVQIVIQVLMAFFLQTWSVVIPRFCLSYSPPELFGTMNGLMCAILGICQMALTPLSKMAVKELIHETKNAGRWQHALPFVVTFDGWCTLAVHANILLLLYWWYHGLPEQGSIAMKDLVEQPALCESDVTASEAGESSEARPLVAAPAVSSQPRQPRQSRPGQPRQKRQEPQRSSDSNV